MNDFRAKFLEESIKNLISLQKSSAKVFSEINRREFFRIIHSVKGSAQTFGLANAAELANELENLLSQPKIIQNKNLQTSLFEGIELLISALQEKNVGFSDNFIKRLKTETAKTFSKSNLLFTDFPYEIFRKLSENEKKTVIDDFCENKNIFLVKVSFKKAEFGKSYQDFREILNQNGEIIAALPDLEFSSTDKIGFRILSSTVENTEILTKKIKDFSSRITIFQTIKNPANNLSEMFSEIVKHTKDLGKNVGLTIAVNDVSLSDAVIKEIFEIILHLVRNAIDHSFNDNGELKIFFFAEDKRLFLTVSDNGKGIDLEKVRQRAIEKNLILRDDTLNEQQTLELIFASELSTADKISEISGRGIGLEIVKNSVKKLNGKISVKSRKDYGTKFEIILPLEEI